MVGHRMRNAAFVVVSAIPAVVPADEPFAIPPLGPIPGAGALIEAAQEAAEEAAVPGEVVGGELHGSVALPEDSQLRRRLGQAVRLVASGKPEEAATALGRLAESVAESDAFIRPEGEPQSLRSFRAEVQRQIGELPPEGLAAYRLAFGPAAGRMFDEAVAAGGEAGLQRVAGLYRHTDAGADALYRLAAVYRDRGRFAEAAACLDRLRSGNEVPAGAVETLLAECIGRLVGEPRDETGEPFLVPRWSRETATAPAVVTALVRSRPATGVPAAAATVVAGQVLVPTRRGFAAFDLASGRPLWAYPSDGGFGLAPDEFWGDLAGGRVAGDGRAAYLVESDAVAPAAAATVPVAAFMNRAGGPWGGLFPVAQVARFRGDSEIEPAVSAESNVLTALAVAPPRQGNRLWQVGGPMGGDEPALAGHMFLGPPAASDGRLYAVAEAGRTIKLVVLDSRTGRLDWSLPLADAEIPLSQDPFRRRAGGTPRLHQGTVLCPTSGGAVVAVDLAGRSLLWGYRYARNGSAGMPDADPAAGRAVGHWAGEPMQVVGDVLLLSPPESDELHAVEAATGRPLWKRSRDGAWYVAAAVDRAVVVGPSAVTILNPADGAVIASTSLPAMPTGHGFADTGGYLVPLGDGTLTRIDVSAGTAAVAARGHGGVVLGNLVWRDGVMLSVGPDFLRAFDDRRRIIEAVEATLAGHPTDADALLRRSDLHAEAGRYAEAITDARRAYEVSRTPRAKNRLVVALLDGFRRGLPDSAAYDAELDRLARE